MKAVTVSHLNAVLVRRARVTLAQPGRKASAFAKPGRRRAARTARLARARGKCSRPLRYLATALTKTVTARTKRRAEETYRRIQRPSLRRWIRAWPRRWRQRPRSYTPAAIRFRPVWLLTRLTPNVLPCCGAKC